MFQPWGGHKNAEPPLAAPRAPSERERCSQPCGEHPLPAGRGCPAPAPAPGVAMGQGGTQHHTALAPKAGSLGVTLWQCHPKPSRCFRASPHTQRHPRAAQPHGKTVCSSSCRSPGQVTGATRPVFPAWPFPNCWQGPALAHKVPCVTGATVVPQPVSAGLSPSSSTPSTARGLHTRQSQELLGAIAGASGTCQGGDKVL